MYPYNVLFLISTCILLSCSKINIKSVECTTKSELLTTIESPEGNDFKLYSNGEAYSIVNGECVFEGKIFKPGFYEEHYIDTDSGTYLIVNDTVFFNPYRIGIETFETQGKFQELFIHNVSQVGRYFSEFTIVSPEIPTYEDFLVLEDCVFQETCSFIDNSIALAKDPENSDNTILKFKAIVSDQGNLVSKSSIRTNLTFFRHGEDFWFESKFYLESGSPTTIADFECMYFEGGPGPRIIIQDGALAMDNKFGAKLTFAQNEPVVKFPVQEWVKVKVHLRFDDKDGIIQMWQDDILILDKVGQNIPLDLWLLSTIEVGITATSRNCELLIDDMRFSDKAF